MAKIYMNTDAVLDLQASIKAKTSVSTTCLNQITNIQANLPQEVLDAREIGTRLYALKEQVAKQKLQLNTYATILVKIVEEMQTADDKIKSEADCIAYQLNKLSALDQFLSTASAQSKSLWTTDLSTYNQADQLLGGEDVAPNLSSQIQLNQDFG